MLRFWLACGEYFCLNWHFYKTNKNNVCLTCTLHLVEMKIPSLSTHPHADGKPGEVSQSTKYFWSWTALQNFHEQLTSIETCVKTVENNWKEKKNLMVSYSSAGVIQDSRRPQIDLRGHYLHPERAVELLLMLSAYQLRMN